MLDFTKKRDNTQRQVSFHKYRCRVGMYLVFVFLKEQYESKYGYWWWSLKSKRSTSILINSKFSYLNYIFHLSLYIYHHHHHHHHIALVARISLTLSRHSSLSFIALGRSSGQHPVSSHSCWMYVRAGRPDFARPCVGIHKSTSLMSSSLLLQ